MNHWLFADTRLPPTSSEDPDRSQEVLAIDTSNTIRVAYVQYTYTYEGTGEYDWKIAGRDFYDFPNVTHWMHLPLSPSSIAKRPK